jgi:hypothetical protein
VRKSKEKDFASADTAATYLQELVDCPPMVLAIEGGGLISPQSISPEAVRVIGVWELERIIKLLESK